MKVFIAPDFKNLWPEHTVDELAQLEANCLADPDHERMPPIILWKNHKNTVVDGHHQLAIREKHRLKIRYASLEFETRDHAKAFAAGAQLGRRNLTESQVAIAIAEVYRLRRYAHGGNRKNGQAVSVPLEKLAETAGISEKTMRSAANVVDKAATPIVEGVKAGDFSVSDATTILDRPKKQQTKIAAKAKREGKTLDKAATEFEPAKLDRQPLSEKPKRSGQPVVSTKDRKDALQTHAKLCRALSKMGIYNEFIIPLSQIAERLKSI